MQRGTKKPVENNASFESAPTVEYILNLMRLQNWNEDEISYADNEVRMRNRCTLRSNIPGKEGDWLSISANN